MTYVFGLAMGALALGVPLALRARRLAALCSAAGCVALVVVGLDSALGGARPLLGLGDWLGFGHSALRADGLAGIFLALTGLTGAAVSLAYAARPATRWLTALASGLLLFVAVSICSDNGFLFLLAWEVVTVCVYLIASAQGDRDGLRAGFLTGGLAKLGGGALLAAVGLLYAQTHSFSLEVWAHSSLTSGFRSVLFVLFLNSCFATRSGSCHFRGGSRPGTARRRDSAPRRSPWPCALASTACGDSSSRCSDPCRCGAGTRC